MVREDLRAASDHLRAAAVAANDAEHEQRLYDQSDALAELATADQGPDHGRLARVQQKLSDIAEETTEDAAGSIQDAKDSIRAYRETVEGV